jgi:hypothetical protein
MRRPACRRPDGFARTVPRPVVATIRPSLLQNEAIRPAASRAPSESRRAVSSLTDAPRQPLNIVQPFRNACGSNGARGAQTNPEGGLIMRTVRTNMGNGRGERRLATVAVALLLALVGTTAHATETITVIKDAGGSGYFIASSPSSESRCHPDDLIFPASIGAVKTFKKKLDPVISVIDSEFTCKAELYRGAGTGTCGAFKLSCTCVDNCSFQFPF